MKINEVDKVTTLTATECITAIAADKSLIQIPVSELAKVMAQVMPVATSEKNGLMSVNDRGHLRYFSIFYIVGNINIGNVNGLIRFKIWSITSGMSLYFVSSKGNVVSFIAGKDVTEMGYALSINSSSELILEDKINNGRVTHILGLSENIV